MSANHPFSKPDLAMSDVQRTSIGELQQRWPGAIQPGEQSDTARLNSEELAALLAFFHLLEEWDQDVNPV